MTPRNIAQLFFQACEKYQKPDAVMVPVNGTYQSLSHDFFRQRVCYFGQGLIATGVQPGEHIAILAETCFDWAVADLGIVCAGCVDVPIYPTHSAEQIAWILNHSDSVGVVVGTRALAEKIASIARSIPRVRFICTMDNSVGDGAIAMNSLEDQGHLAGNRVELESRVASLGPEDLLTVIYTSGTTGDPKGVMLSHGNLISNIEACSEIAPFTSKDIHLSHLPLSHVFERMGGYYLAIHQGITIAYAESIEKLSDNMMAVKPTILFSVPRLFEKIYTRVLTNALSANPLKKLVFKLAMGAGREAMDDFAHNRVPQGFTARKWAMADKLVFSKIKERTGGRLAMMIAGGAPLSPEISEMFLGMGIVIAEGYGLTETSPVLAINPPDRIKPGRVGPPIRGVELKIAEDGEILARGPNIMMGYYKNEEATAAVISDGWLKTGDIGDIDDDGFLRITDRKKDLIITSGGKNVAPQPLENALQLSPFIEHAVIVGNSRRFIGALIVPPWDSIRDWAPAQGWSLNPEVLIQNPEFEEVIAREVGLKMKNFAHYEKVKKFEILPRSFSVAGGELTPSLKVKRKAVNQKYAAAIDRIYA